MNVDPRSFKGLARFLAPSAGGSLADRALAENLIRPDQLDDCLKEQDRTGRGLDEILVERNLVSAEAVERLRRTPLPPEAAAAAADPARVFGQYILVSLEGTGGMAEVWKAWDQSMFRWVAIKHLKPDVGHGAQRLEREARTAGRLMHPNIIPIHEVGNREGRPYLVMPLIDGKPPPAPLELREAVRIVREIARALDHVHQAGLLHRDVKPGNILLEQGGRPMLADFGLAVPEEHSTTGFGMSGTPQYASPEQLRGEPLDARTDVYSLGATLYHFVAGRPPYTGDNPEQISDAIRRGSVPPMPKVPGRLASILRKSMATDRAARYATMAEFSRDLDGFLQSRARSVLRPSVLLVLALVGLLSSGATYFYISATRRAATRFEAQRSYREGQRLLTLAEQSLQGGGRTSEFPGLLSKAVPEFYSSIWLNGGAYPEASVALGRCYELMGLTSRAEQSYQEAGAVADARIGLARIGMRRLLDGDKERDWRFWSLGHIEAARNPDRLEVREALRSFIHGRWAEMIDHGRAASEVEPADDLLLALMGWSAREAGKADESVRWLDAALRVRGDSASLWYQRALSCEARGDASEALRSVKRALATASPAWPLFESARSLQSKLQK